MTPGATDIHLTCPKSTLQLQHPHNYQSYFEFKGKCYGWDGHSELFERNSGKVLARVYLTWDVMDESEHQIVKLVILDIGKEIEDIVVMTSLIVQGRSEQGLEAVLPHRMCPN